MGKATQFLFLANLVKVASELGMRVHGSARA